MSPDDITAAWLSSVLGGQVRLEHHELVDRRPLVVQLEGDLTGRRGIRSQRDLEVAQGDVNIPRTGVVIVAARNGVNSW